MAVFAAAIGAISRRIHEEEAMLVDQLGDAWTQHAVARWRMFPFVW